MRVIVPLKGLLGGRYGLALGCVIPLLSFYFMQLRPRKNLPPAPKAAVSDTPNPDDDSKIQAPIAERALSVISIQNTPFYLGEREVLENLYDAELNPGGCIHLGMAENKLSLDLLQDWLSSLGVNSLDLNEGAGYVDFRGLKSFRTVLARFMGVAMGGRVSFDPANMVVTAGATPINEMLAFCLAQPGDAFLIPSPYYAGFERDIKWRSQVELIPVPCYSDSNFTITPGALESTFRKLQKRGTKVRGVIITNPSNPVGSVLDHSSLISVFRFVKDNKIHLIADEIYAACIFEDVVFTSVAEILMSEQYNRSFVHIIYGLSKDLGLAGFRVGVLYSWNKQVLDAASRMARFCAASTPTQQLLTALLSDEKFINTFLFENRKRLTNRYNKVTKNLEQAGIRSAKSEGGLFCYIDLRHFLRSSTEEEEMKLWKYLLYKVGLHLTPGSSCCCDEPGWFRVCFAGVDDETMTVALNRFDQFAKGAKY